MYSDFVLDCSVAMTWCFADQATRQTDALLDRLQGSSAFVPSVWLLEVANVLWVNERLRKISLADAVQFKTMLMHLPIIVDDTTIYQAFSAVSDLARAWDLTAYDAAYLELAVRKSLPLASLDKALLKVAKKIGVAAL